MSGGWIETRDGTGAEVFTLGRHVITRHKTCGVRLWVKTDKGRDLVSVGFRSVEAAKEHAAPLIARQR